MAARTSACAASSSAYDADTGRLLWKFFTVPGDPANGFENAAMEMAAKTWNGEWWKLGGGGTAWDSITYDPELDLVYIGTGNGSPRRARVSQPGRRRQSLPLLRSSRSTPKPGEYRWHYQKTPGEEWDYTCTQPMILADLPIDGQHAQGADAGAEERLLLRARPRHRRAAVSARNFVPVNWATTSTSKPAGRSRTPRRALRRRAGAGHARARAAAHNWFPMAYSPQTQLAYFPAYEHWFVYALRPGLGRRSRFRSNGGWGGYTGERCRNGSNCRRKATRARRPSSSPGIR